MNSLVQILTSTILVGLVFFMLSPTVAIFAFLPMPLVFLAAFYFQKRAAILYADVRDHASALGARLSNSLSGIAIIRSFTSEDEEVAKLAQSSMLYQEANRRAIAVTALFNPLVRIGVLIGFLATFIVGGVLALKGQLNVGSYGILVFLSQRLLWPLRDLASIVDLFERAMASADRVLNVFSIPIHLEVEKPEPQFANTMHIEFHQVHFSYSNQVPVLKGISLQLPAHKTVAIVGPTGSGKSTITKLLLRYYQVRQGCIEIGGVAIDDCNPKSLREKIGLVSQDVFLFEGSIFDNIAYGRKGATRDEVYAAARRAYATEFIDRLPQGMDTRIGERGQKLSGGQRQRVALARVILKDSPILIFDEATSAVDNETEAIIQKSLVEISRNRSTLIIAHRLSTIVHADYIYVLSQGQIIDAGTHTELLQRKGLYEQLWSLQLRN